LWAAALLGAAQPRAAEAAPYPASDIGLAFDWSTFRRHAQGSDNWPATWAANGQVYSAWGDGGGFGQSANAKARVSIGFGTLSGTSARSLGGRNLIGGLSPSAGRCFPKIGMMADPGPNPTCKGQGLAGKTWGVLALGDMLYAWISPGSNVMAYKEQRLYRAKLGTNSWTKASWAFKPGDPYPLLHPAFVQAGRNHGDLSGYVYAYAPRLAPTSKTFLSIQKSGGRGEIALLRVPKSANLMDRRKWQFFAGMVDGKPTWTTSMAKIRPVIVDAAGGVGWNVSGQYVKSLKRFVVAYEHTETHAGRLAVLEAANPWGPWRTVYYGNFANPAKKVPATAFYYNFLPTGFSGDRFTMLFTGRYENDSLNVIDGRFVRK
jgi:hypothetical protein